MHKKSTDTDMTPFVDIAFLILSFFIMATKFKPPEPVQINIPNSVSSQLLPENDAVMVSIDSANRVFFRILSLKDQTVFDQIIQNVNASRNLGLTPAEMANFRKTATIGVPFQSLKGLLDLDPADQAKVAMPGIPVLDTNANELTWWIAAAKKTFADVQRPLKYLIKGDGGSKYPSFEATISALKRNDEYKYNLVTSLENAPVGSELERAQRQGKTLPK